MFTLQQLREKRAEAVASMEAILDAADKEGRDLTAEEAELYQAYQEDLTKIKADIARRENLEAEKSALEETTTPAVAGQSAGAAAKGPKGPEAKREFGSVGEFMGAVLNYYSSHGRNYDQRLEFDENAAIQAAADGQNMSDGSTGGFLVPSQYRDQLLMVSPQEAIIEGRSNVMEVGFPPDAEVTMPALDQSGSTDNVYGGVEMNWLGEADIKPKTEAKFREVSLTPKELGGHIPLTDKLMRNAPAATGQIELLMRGALIGAKEHSYLLGDGVNRPLGVLTSGATIKVNRTTANQIVQDDLAAMLSKLLMRGGSPYWMINQSALTQLIKLKDEAGNNIWQTNAIEGSPGSLYGYPVFWHERSPQLGTYGDVTLCNSNPYYLIKPGSGPYVSAGWMNDDFAKNQTRIKVFTNVDAKPWLTEPFTQEGGHQVSPFVALDVPST